MFFAAVKMFSSDIMGGVSDYVESSVGGVALFINGDAGMYVQRYVCVVCVQKTVLAQQNG